MKLEYLLAVPLAFLCPVEASGCRNQLLQARDVPIAYQGRFATGGPHSLQSNRAHVSVSPRVENKPRGVRKGSKQDIARALQQPYEVLFGHKEVTRANYMKFKAPNNTGINFG